MTTHPPEKRIKMYNHESRYVSKHPVPTLRLPNDVVEKIISLSPIKRALNLSLLSKRFRDSWRYSRYLRFDKDFASRHDKTTRIDVIHRIVDLHLGNKIHEFSMYIDPICFEGLFRDTMKKVTAKHVEELDLDFCEWQNRLFSCCYDLLDVDSIRVLRLSNLVLDLPLQFKGLCFLKTLVLKEIKQDLPKFIKTLFTNCFLIEELELITCYWIHALEVETPYLKKFKVSLARGGFEFSSLNIDTPNLRSFHYHGEVRRIKFQQEMVLLDDVILDFIPIRSFKRYCGLKDILTSISSVNFLKVSGAFLEDLSQKFVNGELKEQPFSFGHLKEFHLCLGMSFINLFDVASFLKNCPNIERLFIDFGGFYGHSTNWEAHAKNNFEHSDQPLQNLKFITLKGLKCEKPVFEMLKYFLRKACFLETLVVVSDMESHRHYFNNLWMHDESFLPASPNARIEVYSYLEDKRCMQLTGKEDFS